MKVKLELDPDQKETEITIHAGQLTPEIERIYQQLQMDSDHPDQIEGMMDNTSYYLSINDILKIALSNYLIRIVLSIIYVPIINYILKRKKEQI